LAAWRRRNASSISAAVHGFCFDFEADLAFDAGFDEGLAALPVERIANFDAGCEAGGLRPAADALAPGAVARDFAAPDFPEDGFPEDLGFVPVPALDLAGAAGDVDVAGLVFRAMPQSIVRFPHVTQ
jgi:hypothetical protein